MSHASNKVNWCLRKAKKEIEDGQKHRGLLEIKGAMDEARLHLAKAEHNLLAVPYFSEGGFSDWSMSAVFYYMYHCFLAIASKFGYESRNQECTLALVKYLKEQGKIVFDDQFFESLQDYNDAERHESSIIEKREYYTYGTSTSVEDKEELEKNIKLCKDCLNKTKEVVFGTEK